MIHLPFFVANLDCHSGKSVAKVIHKLEFSTADLSGIHLKNPHKL
jgi:hypothetical protein